MDATDHRETLLADQLVKTAVLTRTLEGYLAALGPILRSSPSEVERVFLSLKTLHPAFRARTYLWQWKTKRVSVREWPHGLRNRPGYYQSPDFRVHSTGAEFRVRNLQEIRDHPCDLYGKLKADGYTDYFMLPLPFSDGTINTLSFATKLPGGFPTEHLERVRRLSDILVVVFERYAALETVNSALDTYLGRSVAREILSGHIRAGYGEATEAAILFADLNDFTGHAARLDPAHTVRLLNDYFDCLVGPIEEHGGYVLKFIGDAILAFFPVLLSTAEPRPLDAVLSIRERLAELNRARIALGEFRLGHALCVHYGRVLYGNVGSSERLDFTVIGEPVNVAARGVEAAKSSGHDYVLTDAFVRRFGNKGLVSIGQHAMRGIAEPMELYTPEVKGQ